MTVYETKKFMEAKQEHSNYVRRKRSRHLVFADMLISKLKEDYYGNFCFNYDYEREVITVKFNLTMIRLNDQIDLPASCDVDDNLRLFESRLSEIIWKQIKTESIQ